VELPVSGRVGEVPTAVEVAERLEQFRTAGMVDAKTFAEANKRMAEAANKVWDEMYQQYLSIGAPCGASEEGMIRWYRRQRPEEPSTNPLLVLLDGLTTGLTRIFGADPAAQERGIRAMWLMLLLVIIPALMLGFVITPLAGVFYIAIIFAFGWE
jgi:hypothetical protein